MTKHRQPQGIGKVSRKVWSVDGDRGKTAHALLDNPKLHRGNIINVSTANQLGSMQYKVVADKRGKKSLKVTYDPKEYYNGGKSRKGKRNTRKNRK